MTNMTNITPWVFAGALGLGYLLYARRADAAQAPARSPRGLVSQSDILDVTKQRGGKGYVARRPGMSDAAWAAVQEGEGRGAAQGRRSPTIQPPPGYVQAASRGGGSGGGVAQAAPRGGSGPRGGHVLGGRDPIFGAQHQRVVHDWPW